jgi:hypothetical protein
MSNSTHELGVDFGKRQDRAMGVVEELRQVIQNVLAPKLYEIHVRLDAMDELSEVRHGYLMQRLEQIQQSFAFDKRISNLEAEKTRSA